MCILCDSYTPLCRWHTDPGWNETSTKRPRDRRSARHRARCERELEALLNVLDLADKSAFSSSECQPILASIEREERAEKRAEGREATSLIGTTRLHPNFHPSRVICCDLDLN